MFKIKTKRESGQTLVEFALILPVLLLIIFGIIQFGIIYNTHLIITSAAREGARKAVVTDVKADVGNAITYAVASLNATVSESDSAKGSTMPGSADTIWWCIDYLEYDAFGNPFTSTGHPVTVYVKGRVDINIPIISSLTGNSIMIPANATMRIEHS